jgi:ClpP class serine protease
MRADFFDLLAPMSVAPMNAVTSAATVVHVTGPLDHHDGTCFDSYDAIRIRVAAACEPSAPQVVILKIDSPGGDVSGCFETARALRSMAAAAGKRLIAFVDGQACSAAYALACAGTEIVCGEASALGSIGVIHTAIDASLQDAALGLRFTVTTSGERKADGHPHVPVSDGARAAFQGAVDALAGVFFATVSELRPQLVQPAGLQASVLYGAQAVAAGLADRIAPFDVEKLAATPIAPTMGESQAPEIQTMNLSEAIAALEEAAAGEGADAELAKKMLDAAKAGLDAAPPPPPPADDKEEKPADDDDKPADDAPPAAAKPEHDDCAAASDADVDARVAAEVNARASLLASRPDISAELRATLASMSTAQAKAVLAGMPVATPAAPKSTPADVINARGVLPASIDGTAIASQLPAPEAAALDAAMGLTQYEPGVRHEGNLMFLGAPIVKGKG